VFALINSSESEDCESGDERDFKDIDTVVRRSIKSYTSHRIDHSPNAKPFNNANHNFDFDTAAGFNSTDFDITDPTSETALELNEYIDNSEEGSGNIVRQNSDTFLLNSSWDAIFLKFFSISYSVYNENISTLKAYSIPALISLTSHNTFTFKSITAASIRQLIISS